jgi:hypothetical protein
VMIAAQQVCMPVRRIRLARVVQALQLCSGKWLGSEVHWNCMLLPLRSLRATPCCQLSWDQALIQLHFVPHVLLLPADCWPLLG